MMATALLIWMIRDALTHPIMMKQILFTSSKAKKLLPQRAKSHNKTHGGKTLIIAGHQGFFGAAVLAATASARVGSGYTTLMIDEKDFPIHQHPDFLILSNKITKQKQWLTYHAIAVGPGLGVNARTEKIILSLLKNKVENVILDADALTVIAQKNIYPLRPSWLLTPHTGELARLLRKKKIQKHEKLKSLQGAQQKYHCHILLKGPETLILSSNELTLIKSGNQALAKAGTGDVLTGIIAGLIAQGLTTSNAAALGAYLHGICSQIWVREKKYDHLSLLASDLLLLIPKALTKLRH
jgi:NAD(P)H-hydrate epimerase